MADTTTTTNIPAMQDAMAVRALIKRNVPYAVFDLFGGTFPFSRREGMTIRRRKYLTPVAVNVASSEGITPPASKPTPEDYEATIKQYIGWSEISDVVAESSIEAVEAEIVEWLNEKMWTTRELVYRDLLLGGTSVYYGNGAVSRVTTTSKVLFADLQNIERQMFTNKASYFSAMTKGAAAYGTAPIGAAYIIVAHVDTKKDFESMTNWKPVELYASQIQTYPSEVGSVGNFRVIMTQLAEVYADAGSVTGAGTTYNGTTGVGCDIYPLLIFGKNAYDVIPFDALSTKLIKHPFGHGDDPAEQRETMAYKFATSLMITDQLSMYRLEVCASV
jgi:N4-gp56 family major capsid protein